MEVNKNEDAKVLDCKKAYKNQECMQIWYSHCDNKYFFIFVKYFFKKLKNITN